MLTVTVDNLPILVEEFQGLPNKVRSALTRSVNRSIVSAQTIMARLIATDMRLKVGDVKKAFRLEKASDSRPSATVAAGLKRLPLIQFNAKGPEPSHGKGSGVSYRLQGGRDRIPNAFIATMKSGHRGVFVRTGKGRLPIRELFGPSLGKVFIKFQPQGEARARESFVANFEHEMGRLGLLVDPALAAQAVEDDAAAE